ncbi:hypothetical protein GC163_13310 [bacterium]|nr:hypothetical protein [bacterium]
MSDDELSRWLEKREHQENTPPSGKQQPPRKPQQRQEDKIKARQRTTRDYEEEDLVQQNLKASLRLKQLGGCYLAILITMAMVPILAILLCCSGFVITAPMAAQLKGKPQQKQRAERPKQGEPKRP